MPRAENPLETDGSALTAFAAGLRALRENAGNPSYRELARRAHFSATTLSDAAGGRRLPSLAVTLAYVRACGGDGDEWERRWRATAAELTTPAPAAGTAPYRGLAAYDHEDADFFFGRDRLVETLLARIATHRRVIVTGASGSGKTSLLRAGLALRLTGPVVFTTARELRRVPEAASLVVVDQCEELFTPGRDDDRARFAAALRADGPRVVLAVRADFADRCADLLGAAPARVEVGPMTPDELRQAITGPAARVRCMVETPLLTTAVALAHGRAGALPWLSQALLETWRRRSGNRLTLAGFQAAGEFGALPAAAAEAVFAALGPAGQAVARDLFRRLADPLEGLRAVDVDELDDTPLTADVVGRFVRARVLVRDAHRLRLAHEAVLDAWPRLRDRSDGPGRTHRELTRAATAWRRHHRDPSLLPRGAHLAAVRAWARPPRHLTTHERAYLDAGTAAEARARRARHGRHLVVLAAVLVLAAPGPPGGGQAGCGPSAVVLSGPLSAAAPVPAPDNAER